MLIRLLLLYLSCCLPQFAGHMKSRIDTQLHFAYLTHFRKKKKNASTEGYFFLILSDADRRGAQN